MYHYEPEFWCHAQMDFDGVIENYNNNVKVFTDLDSLIKNFSYIENRKLLSVISREEDDRILKHKILMYEDKIVCSFDYEFSCDELPESKILLKDLRPNNMNISIPYSKWAIKKYNEYGTLYTNFKL